MVSPISWNQLFYISSLLKNSQSLFFIRRWNFSLPVWLSIYIKGIAHLTSVVHIHSHLYLTTDSTPVHVYLTDSRSYFTVPGPLHILPFQCYLSCLVHTIPPKKHHASYHYWSHNTILWCMWTDRPPCGHILEMRPTFSRPPYPTTDAPVQP